MKIIRTKQLDLHQLEDLHALETACRSHDQTSLTFPTEDGCLFFLLYDEETLLSAFSAIFNEFETCSCSAFTLPSCRRRGHFTRLLEELLKESGECDLLFLADDSCADAKHTLDAIGAELLNREHMMELRLPAPSPGLDSRAVKFSPALSPQDEDTLYTIHVNDQPTGSFHLIFQNETVYFYGFEIQESLRNQGIGTRAAAALIEELNRSARPQPEDLPVSRVLLQVSGDNEPALALYRKLGFAFTETLSYYVY
ncbi:hypothetical protein HMPREF1093_00470 [Hungatella hathewayi 12489931]|uniref:GNAT family N-acetyltransferase n=1 Tax=Hungatella hathewayi TaxID=154046 RepID=UPI0002D1BC13|nr:GNAT family N-acetyltransferase [Hungatella hathewayi]ENY99260.1 hypothetical protein HMPREF1093_00470 [Hungatella hathewayi 12489931]